MRTRSGGLFVGGLEGQDGAVVMFEALELHPGASVDIVPPGVSGAELRRRIQRCAFLVLPGLSYVAVPQALVMAFAEGAPVIASRLPVFDDVLEAGRNGLLFDPGSARELARRHAWAEAFPEKMRQMGECAQADYQCRFGADWGYQRLFGERRQYARAI